MLVWFAKKSYLCIEKLAKRCTQNPHPEPTSSRCSSTWSRSWTRSIRYTFGQQDRLGSFWRGLQRSIMRQQQTASQFVEWRVCWYWNTCATCLTRVSWCCGRRTSTIITSAGSIRYSVPWWEVCFPNSQTSSYYKVWTFCICRETCRDHAWLGFLRLH